MYLFQCVVSFCANVSLLFGSGAARLVPTLTCLQSNSSPTEEPLFGRRSWLDCFHSLNVFTLWFVSSARVAWASILQPTAFLSQPVTVYTPCDLAKTNINNINTMSSGLIAAFSCTASKTKCGVTMHPTTSGYFQNYNEQLEPEGVC